MSNRIYEVIPCRTFKERIRLTKSLLNKGITCIENLESCLLITRKIKI